MTIQEYIIRFLIIHPDLDLSEAKETLSKIPGVVPGRLMNAGAERFTPRGDKLEGRYRDSRWGFDFGDKWQNGEEEELHSYLEKREYFLLGWIKRILRERDPLGLISMGSPEDEYDPEAYDIFNEIEKDLVGPDLNQIVTNEFNRMFGMGGYTDTKQAKDAFAQVAQDIENKMKELGDSIRRFQTFNATS